MDEMNEKFYEFKEKRKGSKIPLKKEGFLRKSYILSKVKKIINKKGTQFLGSLGLSGQVFHTICTRLV